MKEENNEVKETKQNKKVEISVLVLIVLFIVAVVGGLLLGKILFEKTNPKELKTEENEKLKDEIKDEEQIEDAKNEEMVEEQIEDVKDQVKVEEVREKYSFTGENNNRYINIEVSIINDNEMMISSGDGMAQIEGTKGVYYINDDVLTYTRIYYDFDFSGDKYWIPCSTIDDQNFEKIKNVYDGIGCGGVSRMQKFTIDKVNHTLILNTKQSSGTDYEKIDDYARYDDIVLRLQ